MQTIATPPTYSPDEHAIVRLLSASAAAQVMQMQAHLQELLGDAIWLQKPPALHSTLMEIICDTEYTGKTRRQYFDAWYATYGEITQEVLSTIQPFDIAFTELVVSPRAIIIKSADSKPMNAIREALLAHIELPPGTKIPPTITHCSLARFTQSIDVERAQQLVAEISVDITEHVSEFSLAKDLCPPDFNGSTLRKYPLHQA